MLLVLLALLVLVGAKVTFPLLAANATAARATGKGPRGTGKGGWAPRGHLATSRTDRSSTGTSYAI